MTGPETRWLPGSQVALVWDSGLVLVSGDTQDAHAERLWTSLRREPSLEVFLEVLAEASGRGLLQLPPFAVALMTPQGCHIAVRGRLSVTVATGGEKHTFNGEGVTTWLEKQLPLPESIHMVGENVTGEGLPIRDGIVRAGALSAGLLPSVATFVDHVDLSKPVELDPPTARQPATPLSGGDSGPDPAGDSDKSSDQGAAPIAPAADQESAVEAVDPRLRETRVEEEAGEAGDPDGAQSERALPGEVDDPAGESLDNRAVAAGKYESLWGASIAVSAEEAAVRLREDEEGRVAPPSEPSSSSSNAGNEPIEAVQATPVLTGVPVSSPSPPEDGAPIESPVGVPATAGSEGDLHDGHTVMDAGEEVPVSFELPEDSGAPMILASFCQRGHANPPQRELCRICRSPVDSRTERTPRPAMGRMRLSSGEIIELIGPIIAGRSPSGAGRSSTPPARLVSIPHPHVSGNHLEITFEGWTVLVRDLRSRNGTYLRRQGKPPVRLPEQAMPLADGDVLDLGHGVFIYMEQLP
ncbi:MAG: hypothetical protein CSA84_00855 [Actinomycetales bacterium]|nr:MAG: hypothetical protein CSA84_00855 [Actinomycetales bacterium]